MPKSFVLFLVLFSGCDASVDSPAIQHADATADAGPSVVSDAGADGIFDDDACNHYARPTGTCTQPGTCCVSSTCVQGICQ
jgi:hypothetical protein